MTAPVVQVYRPRGNAAAIMKAPVSRAPAVVLSGPAGTGKSAACLTKLHLACMLKPNVRALIVRKTFASIRHSALVTFQNFVAPNHIASGLVNIYGGTVPQQIQYLNGSTIDIVGMDKPTRIMSTDFDLIYVQEAIELEREHWDALSSRARASNLSYRQLLADCNPSHDQHFLLQMAQEGKLLMLETQHEDNPLFFDDFGCITPDGEAYLARLDDLTGVWLARLRYGKWVGAQGIIYDNFDRNVHVVDELPKGWESWPVTWAIDFGFVHPLVVTMWVTSPDGALYMFAEYYRKGVLVEDMAKDLRARVASGELRRPGKILTDHDAEDRATFEKHFGRGTNAAKKEVSRGIQAAHARFKVQANGRARLYFKKDALLHRPDKALVDAKQPTHTLAEIGGYIWDPNGKDQPLKDKDDGMDTMRYVVADKDLTGDYNIRWLQ